SRIRLYDIAGDKFVDRFPGFKGDSYDVAFTSDGKLLVTVDHRHGTVRVWNVEAGKEERSFRVMPDAGKEPSHHVARTTLSADGKTLAVAYHPFRSAGAAGPVFVGVWNVTTGKGMFSGHPNDILDMTLSPDGRWLA